MNPSNPSSRVPVLYQLSTLGALVERVYDSNTTCAELAQHGDFGLGAFNHLDGEMIVLKGKFYQVAPDGSAHLADPSAKAAFASLTFFDPTTTLQIKESCNLTELKARVDAVIRSRNVFHAIKVECDFDEVSLRTVLCQHDPYPSFVEVCKHQAEMDQKRLRGTLVGFRSPRFAAEFSVAGYHLHFIDSERSRGGHVIDAVFSNATLQIEEITRFELELLQTSAYFEADIEKTYAKTIAIVETSHQAAK